MNDELFLDERIEVVATFSLHGRDICTPRKFRRSNGRVYEITEIGLRHPTRQGKRMVHVFDVTDGAADFRLEFDAERLLWRLTREADHA